MRTFSRLKATSMAVAMAGAAVVGGTATPAQAAPSGAQSAQACSNGRATVSTWGHIGYLRCGATWFLADYNRDGSWDEAFGITPNGDVWHDWPGSGGWKRLGSGNVDRLTSVDATDFNHRSVYGVKNGRVWVTDFGNWTRHAPYKCTDDGRRIWWPWVLA